MTTKKQLWHWTLSVSASLSVIVLTLFVIDVIHNYNDKQKDRNKVWNEVSYPLGNVGTVVPKLVDPGDTVNITFKEYCNLGVDVNVYRWVDFLRPNGTISGSFQLRTLQFYPTKEESGCFKNITQPFTVPPDLVGRPGGFDKVRLRSLTTYLKPEQIVSVPSYSEAFLLTPNSPPNGQ